MAKLPYLLVKTKSGLRCKKRNQTSNITYRCGCFIVYLNFNNKIATLFKIAVKHFLIFCLITLRDKVTRIHHQNNKAIGEEQQNTSEYPTYLKV